MKIVCVFMMLTFCLSVYGQDLAILMVKSLAKTCNSGDACKSKDLCSKWGFDMSWCQPPVVFGDCMMNGKKIAYAKQSPADCDMLKKKLAANIAAKNCPVEILKCTYYIDSNECRAREVNANKFSTYDDQSVLCNSGIFNNCCQYSEKVENGQCGKVIIPSCTPVFVAGNQNCNYKR
ncbi:MAG: hypothetical protein HQK53_05695 [Oligoflexia bacterium]|nr:hypothetical protein [Oligoflexia bacterium]